jgi:hypothetical protein
MSNWSRTLLGIRTLSEATVTPTINAGELGIDLNSGTVFNVSLNANITSLSISGVQTTGASSFTIIFSMDGTPRSITWGASILWPGGLPPVLTSTNGKKDVFSFVTTNGGSNWIAFVGGQDL